jgi:hypothetical protein
MTFRKSEVLKLRVYRKASPSICVPLWAIFAVGGMNTTHYKLSVDPATHSIIYQPASDGLTMNGEDNNE